METYTPIINDTVDKVYLGVVSFIIIGLLFSATVNRL